jgi:hypothetical protein
MQVIAFAREQIMLFLIEYNDDVAGLDARLYNNI